MRQTTLATPGFDRYAKTTRRDVSLAEMEAVIPWAEFCSLIEPFYPKAGNGRPPVGLERIADLFLAAMVRPCTCYATDWRSARGRRAAKTHPTPRSNRQIGSFQKLCAG